MRIQSDWHQACLQGIFRTSSSVCLKLSSVFLMSSFFKFSLFYRKYLEVFGQAHRRPRPQVWCGRMPSEKGRSFRRHRVCCRPSAFSFWTALAVSSAAGCSATPCSILESFATCFVVGIFECVRTGVIVCPRPWVLLTWCRAARAGWFSWLCVFQTVGIFSPLRGGLSCSSARGEFVRAAFFWILVLLWLGSWVRPLISSAFRNRFVCAARVVFDGVVCSAVAGWRCVGCCADHVVFAVFAGVCRFCSAVSRWNMLLSCDVDVLPSLWLRLSMVLRMECVWLSSLAMAASCCQLFGACCRCCRCQSWGCCFRGRFRPGRNLLMAGRSILCMFLRLETLGCPGVRLCCLRMRRRRLWAAYDLVDWARAHGAQSLLVLLVEGEGNMVGVGRHRVSMADGVAFPGMRLPRSGLGLVRCVSSLSVAQADIRGVCLEVCCFCGFGCWQLAWWLLLFFRWVPWSGSCR